MSVYTCIAFLMRVQDIVLSNCLKLEFTLYYWSVEITNECACIH